ncbi:MAG TPA: tRNA 2-thiouridine(34) synthase MnmA [Gaiellaceae bacterium]|nr:tRNA 2-thiouridine(34) synthase MnmA [Gaiellaceae bacterium]
MEELFGDASRGGEWAAVRLRVDGQRIVAADAPGLDRDLAGLTLLEAAAVGGETLAVDALANAIGPAVAAPPDPARVAVAMSGGVDSAVALLRAGPAAVGVTLRLWIDPAGPDAARACCSPSAVLEARRTCHELGLPHVTLDLRERFRAAVVGPFVRGYAEGRTPNPCVRCNGAFRFGELVAFADRVGASRLATGHYARIVERGGRPALARAADEAKDQSYMLATVDPALLERLWFPLGGQTKAQTRAEAAAAGLAAASRRESQEACFLGGGDYRAFLERAGLASAPGVVVDESGAPIGAHDGYWRFTPGQRRGLRVGGGGPLYALATDARTNTVVAGPRRALARRRVSVRGRLEPGTRRVDAKLRHRSPAVPASVVATDGGFELLLDSPAYGVAPGQAAVLYADEAVVGAGVITAAA